MARDTMLAGRLKIDDDGVIADCNADLARIVRSTPEHLIGRHVLEITAHADRDRYIAIFHQIRKDGIPVTTVLRIIRANRTHAWVRIDVTAPDWPISGRVAMRVEECSAPGDWIEPAILLNLAAGMLRARRARAATFGDAMFADPAWDLLLAIYIAEAEGRVLTTADMTAVLGIAPMPAVRWIRALTAASLIDYEDDEAEPSATTPIRLAATAHAKFEDHLSDVYRDNRGRDSKTGTARPAPRRKQADSR